MKALLGIRKATILVRLAIVLTLIGSIDCVRSTTDLARNENVCIIIDGQIYCIPGSGGDASSVHAALDLRQLGVFGARPENAALATQRPQRAQRGEATAARDGRPV